MADKTRKSQFSDRSLQKLQRPGINLLIGTFLSPFIQGFLLFTYAGTVAVPRAWFLLAINLIGMFGQIAFIAARNPELVNRRGLWKKKKDTTSWDKIIVPGWGVLSYMTFIIIGLDIRFDGANLGLWSAVVGTALFVFSVAVLASAMLVNKHFETTVRIQTDRNHKVITTGLFLASGEPSGIG